MITCESGVRLVIPTCAGMAFMRLADVLYFEANNIYTTLVSPDLSRQTILCSIKQMEETLCGTRQLIRIHKKYIIPLNKIELFSKSEGGYVVLEGNIQLPVSRYRRSEFLSLLGVI